MMHIELIRTLSGFDSIFFEPMWGNNGDRLIKEASLALFRDLDMHVVGSPKHARAVVINGGGAMTSEWGGVAALLHYLRDNSLPTIVLPSSFFVNNSYLFELAACAKQRDGKVIVFCREQNSYNRLHSVLEPQVQVILSHDMALYLNKAYLSEKFNIKHGVTTGILIVERRDAERSTAIEAQTAWSVPFKTFLPIWLKRPIKRKLVRRRNIQSDFICECLATAKARLGNTEETAVNYIDISDQSICSFRCFLSAVANAQLVFTTRLHVAILCHIFEKFCYLYPTGGVYQKNEQVYLHSLRRSQYVQLMHH